MSNIPQPETQATGSTAAPSLQDRSTFSAPRPVKPAPFGYTKNNIPLHNSNCSNNNQVSSQQSFSRVFSLPESELSVASYRFIDREQTTRRIVSMPEAPKKAPVFTRGLDRLSPTIPPCFESPCSLDDSKSFPLQSVVNSGELVLDVGGGDSTLPSRHSGMSNDDRRTLTDEDIRNGWVPWTGPSPPKPIPALQGPLSLPYARCPSGAEGRCAEGQDLAPMVWGLNEQGSPSSRSPPEFPCADVPPITPQVAGNILNLDNPVFPVARHPMEPPLILPPPRSIVLGGESARARECFQQIALPGVPRNFSSDAGVFRGRQGLNASHVGLGYSWLEESVRQGGSQSERKQFGGFDQISTLPPSESIESGSSMSAEGKSLNLEPSKRLTALEIAQQYHARRLQEAYLSLAVDPKAIEQSPASSTFSSTPSTPLLPTPQMSYSDHLTPIQNRPSSLMKLPTNERDIAVEPLAGPENALPNRPLGLLTSVETVSTNSRNTLLHNATIVTAPPTPGDRQFHDLNFRARRNKARAPANSDDNDNRPRLSAVIEEPTRPGDAHASNNRANGTSRQSGRNPTSLVKASSSSRRRGADSHNNTNSPSRFRSKFPANPTVMGIGKPLLGSIGDKRTKPTSRNLTPLKDIVNSSP